MRFLDRFFFFRFHSYDFSIHFHFLN